jgi:hypothetical protein
LRAPIWLLGPSGPNSQQLPTRERSHCPEFSSLVAPFAAPRLTGCQLDAIGPSGSGRVVPTPHAIDLTDPRREGTGYPPPALSIVLGDSRSCCGTSDRPHASRRTPLGSGPLGCFSVPSESDPRYPPSGEARRAAGGAQAFSALRLGKPRANRVSPPCHFPVWLTGRQCPGLNRAIRVSTRLYPDGPQALSTPCRRCLPARLLRPSSPRTSDSVPVDIRVASAPVHLDIQITSLQPPHGLNATLPILAGSRPVDIRVASAPVHLEI